MNDAVIESIATMTPDGNRLNLPQEQMSNYLLVKKTLLAAGGKYNKNGFIFPDLAENIQRRLCNGEEMNDKKKYQFFQTPIDIAKNMISFAHLDIDDRVLEPSAGHGAIAKEIGVPNLTLIELDEEKVKQLAVTFDMDCRVICQDFLEYRNGTFDKIIMNPPFTKGQDIKHIMHATTMLDPGGRIVAICGNGPRQQEKLKPLTSYWEKLPSGTFKEEGTNVNTVLLVIDG